MSVMMAVHQHLTPAGDEGPGETGHGRGTGRGSARPPFVVERQEDLHRRLTGLFEPHRDEPEPSSRPSPPSRSAR